MDEPYALIGKVVAYVGAFVAATYGVLTFLGKRWIDSKFDERFAIFKHAHEQELERYRQQVNILLSRVTKIHEKEIDVLPQLWKKLQGALGTVASLTSPIQFYPDFHFMNQEALEEFLRSSKLNDADKKLLTMSPDKNAFYQRTIFWYNLRDAKSSVRDFHNFMIDNRIFLSKDLKAEFETIDKLFSTALATRETGEHAADPNLISEAYKVLGEDAQTIVAKIENLVQERLEFTKANAPKD